MFRWLRNGKLWMVELMTITINDGTPLFRLRHFDRADKPWEDPDGALTCPLQRLGDREAVFENPDRDKPRRFVFRRPSDDTYEVRLERPEPDDDHPTVFRFKRKR